MLEYPKWKYALVAFVLMISALYALPNFYPDSPAVQIAAAPGNTVDATAQGTVEGVLKAHNIPYKSIERTADRMLVRFANLSIQDRASNELRADAALKGKYSVALTLASNVPAWLRAIGANRLPLGLDLQGGVHFLMQVDPEATRKMLGERYQSDLYALLREKSIPYKGISRTADGYLVNVLSESDIDKTRLEIERGLPDLLAGTASGDKLSVKIRPEKINEAMKRAVEQNTSTLRNRINKLGVAEPIVAQQGTDRIIVQLPGVQDPTFAKKILGSTATLEYRAVDMTNNIRASEIAATGNVPAESRVFKRRGSGEPIILKKEVIASGDQLTGAVSGINPEDGSPNVSVTLDAAGGQRMFDFTSNNVGKLMAVVYKERTANIEMVDGKEVRTFVETEEVVSSANIQGIFGRQFQTTGLEPTEARELALLLSSGSLAAPIDIVEERVIGPSLGAENIAQGRNAVLLGLGLVVAFMCIYYRGAGVIAIIGLLANILMIVAVLSAFHATMTLPGIAGIVLTMGMAVDANVLIIERIREELRSGSSPMASVKVGYDKAWATIIDTHVTTLLAGIALFAFGSGPIRGFAVVLCTGILTTMYSAVAITYAVYAVRYHRRRKVLTLSV